ncbi:sensor histidine kinase [Aquabacterium sp.]|uniref:sensor histidine kinase n=1 Tax=Aquabacterium sp. TaxID=1872578 RepID=UPI002CA00D14|nr:sensor histidine kinase [Aquabacterium sp.]HSW08336.1 sensor histidine kinase [Aquabacterium sp.]
MLQSIAAGSVPLPCPVPPSIDWRAALSALGDAVAVIDLHTRTLRWTSAAWLSLQPNLRPGLSLAQLERALPGLAPSHWADSAAPRRLSLGASGEWEAQIAPLDAGHRLLRLADRREQGRVLQRQLDDREQLLFTSRVISVGEMATTLAHELNQPIGAAANLLRGLRARLSRRGMDSDESDALDRAIEQVMFASRVIVRIREFTHSHQPRHARVDLSALLRSSASLLDWDLRRTGARLTLQLPDEPVLVRGDEVMLQQVIVNLMRNALDALRTDPPEDPHLSLRLVVGAKEAELQVCDNGCGLGDDAAAKLFVPFASSKPTGMGIGLSICRSFVELHQGRLWFSRNAERGATFHLGLPLLAANSSTPASAPACTPASSPVQ